MARSDRLTHAFATSILAKSQVLQTSNLDPGHVRRVREAIDVDIRKYSDCVTPKVSAAALELAKRLNIDLWRTTWHTQPTFDKGRALFHLEHMTPVSAIRKMCLECTSAEAIAEVLIRHAQAVWILKSENAELTRLGYRSQRADPFAAYDEAGIVLVELNHENEDRSPRSPT